MLVRGVAASPGFARPSARAFAWTIALTLGLLLVAFAARALFVLLAGVLLAVLLETLARFITARVRAPYKVVVVALVLLGLGGVVAFFAFAGPRVAEQVGVLRRDLPRAAASLLERARAYLGDVSLPTTSDLAPAPKTVVAGATGAFVGSAELVGSFIVIFFVGLYGALDPCAYERVVLALVPPDRRDRAREVIHETSRRLGRWLMGRLVAMAFVGVASAIGLSALHVPLALTLGALAGLLTFVEYLGAISSAIPPIVLALGSSPIKALWVIALFTGVHVVEGYVLTPAIARRLVHLPPAYTLAAQTLFGVLFGVIGITFATPSVVIGATLVELLYVRRTLERSG